MLIETQRELVPGAVHAQPVTASAGLPARRAKLLGGVSAVAVLSLFMGLIVNRYLPIHEGWFSYYAQLMHAGKLPYRDFYFFTQPISLGISWVVYGISDKMIWMRYYGLVERICLTGALYYLLSRRFSALASFWATVLAMLVFLSYRSEAFFTYLVTCSLFYVVSLICVHLALTEKEHEGLFLVLAGAFSSLAFFTKQSNGLLGSLAVFFLIAALSHSFRSATRRLLFASAGWTIPAVPVLGWLLHNGLFPPYVQQVFVGASSSKGGVLTVLLSFLIRAVTPFTLGTLLLLLAFVRWRMRKGSLQFDQHGVASRGRSTVLLQALVPAFCILFTFFFPLPAGSGFLIREFFMWIVRVLFWCASIVFIICLTRLLKSRFRSDTFTPVFVIGAFTWAYGCGMSYTIEQQGIFLILGGAVALCFDLAPNKLVKRNLVACCSLLVCLVCWQKYAIAFDWTGWQESLGHTTATSHWPRLKGYRTDAALMSNIDSFIDLVSHASKPGEPVFTFPFMPMFNYVTGHPQPTFAAVHYWDVCPDSVAEADAARVLAAKPSVLVYMEFNDDLWKIHEGAFRAGNRSGQRAIQNAINELVRSGEYVHLRTWFAPFYWVPVHVWARRKREE